MPSSPDGSGPADIKEGMLSPIEEIIEQARLGRMFILVDHEDRENEGDLMIPAQFADAAAVNFMAIHGRGLICLTMTGEQVDQLGLPMMAQQNSSRFETGFTVSIEAREGVTTGISAADRALTIAKAVNPAAVPADIATPGHVFPIRARKGGVLKRAGHTEAGCDIPRLAGLIPSSVICEIMNLDGTMARLPQLTKFAAQHDLKIGSIADLIKYRSQNDNIVIETHRENVVSEFGGEWDMRIFTDQTYGVEHVLLIKGNVLTDEPVLIRAHSLHEASDLLGLGPRRADELSTSMRIIAKEGRGIVCLFREPNHDLYREKDESPRIVRHTGLGAQMLASIGVKRIVLLTNSPSNTYVGLEPYDLTIVGHRPITLD